MIETILLLCVLPAFVEGSAERDDLIRYYFIRGYSNLMIACFLCAIHGVVISVSTVKGSLKRQNLRRRMAHIDLRLVAAACQVCKKLKVFDFNSVITG